MPIPDEFTTIVDRIIELSKRGKVTWKEGSSEWIFLASLTDFSVKVEDSGALDQETEYQFGIVNKEGLDVDGLTVDQADPDYPKIRSLWRMARRQAYHVDDALRGVESQLEKLLQEEEPAPAKELEGTSKLKEARKALEDLSKPEAPLEDEEGT